MSKKRKKTEKPRDREKDTRTVLARYQELLSYSRNAVSDYSQVEDMEMRIILNNAFIDPDTYIRSVTKSRQKTQILISHIAGAIKKWSARNGSTHGGRLRRRIIKKRYLDVPRMTFTEISKEEEVPRHAIVKEHDVAIRELSLLIFGADALENDLVNDLGAVRDNALECPEHSALQRQ